MLNLSMPELAVIGVVALLVLGPERLPGAARTVGALMRRAQRSWSGLRADIERELAADELKRSLKEARDGLGLESIERDLTDARDAIVRDLDLRPAPAPRVPPPEAFPGGPGPEASLDGKPAPVLAGQSAHQPTGRIADEPGDTVDDNPLAVEPPVSR